ncbi:hypothetical protein [Gloeocapsopsis dulcis]|uniref:hypothetical protein n=1 Tax=Gloeocapsopsis dulcis TaxID=2859516 RepID=UPI0030D948EC
MTRFLICGLGSLGQHCVAVLKDHGVAVSALEEQLLWVVKYQIKPGDSWRVHGC